MGSLLPVEGSFRDPSGRVYLAGENVLRTIHEEYSTHWLAMRQTGFLQEAVERGLLLEFKEVSPLKGSWKCIESPKLPFISYPYELSFEQLKDAALHTLLCLKAALKHGLILKDASAYNIQFYGGQPILIDHLSFEKRKPHSPWAAYLQFCKHFLAPLVLMSKRDVSLGKLLRLWTDGIPLELASKLLPYRTKISPFLYIHIHLHAKMQQKHHDASLSAAKAKTVKIDENAVYKLCESLRAAIEDLKLAPQKTEWGDYYEDTNYSPEAAADKAAFITKTVNEFGGEFAVDLGANTGLFSRLLAGNYRHVVAADIDYQAVGSHYAKLKTENTKNITPIIIDLSNPSPALGFGLKERDSFSARCSADMLTALALLHHLVFSAGIPLAKTAEYFSSLLKEKGILVLEFVPEEDSQVRRLLAARAPVLPYSLEQCLSVYAEYFELLTTHKIEDSLRTMLVWRKKNA
jgi:hypothetical protein